MKPGCDGEIAFTERFAGWSCYCTCGWMDAQTSREKIRKAAINHTYGTPKERNAYIGI